MNKECAFSDIVKKVKDYFISIGISGMQIDKYIKSNEFDSGILIKLPEVCIVMKNRKNAKTHQSHIHITGNKREIFYDKNVINDVSISTDWEKTALDISLANIEMLSDEDTSINGLKIAETFTHKKIGVRENQENQVQISNLSKDGEEFMNLRNSLYKGDFLVFLKNSKTEKMFTAAIPSDERKTTKKEIIIEEHIYQENINNDEYDDKPSLRGKIIEKTGKRYAVSVSEGKKALKENNYKCLVESSHPLFLKENEVPYLEAHHLIPMSKQDNFEVSLDCAANIIPLCPYCHRKIHYGKKDDVKQLLTKLFEKRKSRLADLGININLKTLVNYYL